MLRQVVIPIVLPGILTATRSRSTTSSLSAFLWLFYGIRKRDKTIYVACIGWILLDAAVVIGVLLHR